MSVDRVAPRLEYTMDKEGNALLTNNGCPPPNFIVRSNLAPHLMVETFTSSVESQKGAITIQRCSVEN